MMDIPLFLRAVHKFWARLLQSSHGVRQHRAICSPHRLPTGSNPHAMRTISTTTGVSVEPLLPQLFEHLAMSVR
jgi:hypothetical protein